MDFTGQSTENNQKLQFLYSFQNEDGDQWVAKLKNDTLSIKKQCDDFNEIQLTFDAVQAELDGTFDGDYNFEDSCSLRTCEFTRSESYWILSVLLSAAQNMKNIH